MTAIDELVEILEKVGVKPKDVRANSEAYFELLEEGLFGGIGDVPEQAVYAVTKNMGSSPDEDTFQQTFHLENAGLLCRPREQIEKDKEAFRKMGAPYDTYSALQTTEKGKALYEKHAQEFGKMLDGVKGIDQLGTSR